MSPFKWLSLAIGGICFSSVIGLSAYTVGPAWTHAGGSWIDLLLAAGLVGVLTGGLLLLIASTHDHEVHRALTAIHTAIRVDATPTRIRGVFGLDPLVDAAHDVSVSLQSRVRASTAAHREADARLAAAGERLRQLEVIVQAIDAAVLVTDGFNEVVFANPLAGDLLGFSPHSAHRKPVEQVVQDQALVRLIRDAREAARAHPRLRRQVQHRMTRPDGGGVYQVTLQAVAADDGDGDGAPQAGAARAACAGVVVILHDVTQQVQTAERRTDFVASVSHELRTPLSSIKGCLEMLIDGEATDAAARVEFYNIIQTETNRLSRLVDNILNISRIESGAARPRRERIDLSEVVQESLGAAQAQARAKGLTLDRENDDHAPAWIIGDRDMLMQVMHNLLGNAIKYTPDGGRITIALHPAHPPGHVSVAVSDTGIGIPHEATAHVFEKFYRVADHTRVAKGTGLGLNLVKHVIEGVHGGAVGVDSQVGRGSTFTFILPMAEDEREEASSGRAPAGAVVHAGAEGTPATGEEA